TRITNEFLQALCSNDVSRIAAFLADEWVLVTPEGPVDRERFLPAVEAGVLRHDKMQMDVTRVRVYGDIAVVTGRSANTGSFKGNPMNADEWVTDVYRKSDDRWLCVLTQLTPAQGA